MFAEITLLNGRLWFGVAESLPEAETVPAAASSFRYSSDLMGIAPRTAYSAFLTWGLIFERFRALRGAEVDIVVV